MKPATGVAVGRIVHYYPFNDDIAIAQPRAALIAAINDDGSVNLAVVPPTANSIEPVRVDYVTFSEEPHPGCWTWPPRV